MKIKTTACLLVVLFLLAGCFDRDSVNHVHKIYIKKINGKYILYRYGKPFIIKGAAGSTNLDVLSACGGNTIRIWDTVGIDTVLQQANKNHLAVVIGLPMPDSKFMAYYNNPANVAAQFAAFKKLVDKYKSNPAVLMWCVGNELVFPSGRSYNGFYNAFNNIVTMIHQTDPDHPITTTIINFQKKNIFNIKLRTDIDIISFNMFGRLNYLRDDLRNFSWFWKGPT
ncbi:glycoside hydrolase family 2 TIM barrel-domain containing protein [Mucilaginibacter gracilis]|uniref:glycoside hydrolase family 2 TIM barrel-domain containing protein n=1 Tax=Mucilaginibacter gracilis TaxID=423350 RepID=UPI000EB23E1E|nr:glycoside hydrolase family 2 TIM barrel-domain containing protein [Mucilaginibacter gracilis]